VFAEENYSDVGRAAYARGSVFVVPREIGDRQNWRGEEGKRGEKLSRRWRVRCFGRGKLRILAEGHDWREAEIDKNVDKREAEKPFARNRRGEHLGKTGRGRRGMGDQESGTLCRLPACERPAEEALIERVTER